MIKEIKNYVAAGLAAISLAIPAPANAHEVKKDDNGRLSTIVCESGKIPTYFSTEISYDGDSPVPNAVVTDNFQHAFREQVTFDASGIVLKRQVTHYDDEGKPVRQGDEEVYRCDAQTGICVDSKDNKHKVEGFRIGGSDAPKDKYSRSLEFLCSAVRSNKGVPERVKSAYTGKGSICQ